MNKEGEKIRKEERDNFTIVLGSLQSDFRMFGENLSDVDSRLSNKLESVEKKVDMNFEEIGNIKIELNEVKGGIVEMKGDIKTINGQLDNIEKEIISIRKDFDFIKKELNQKVDISYIKNIEKRLERVETHLELEVF